jgi:hypothetical protein
MTFKDYPIEATENAKRALKFYRESNNKNNCLTAIGVKRMLQLANREAISYDIVLRMAKFKRHQQHKNNPYENYCGKLSWDAWGGDAGINWAIKKVNEIKLNSIKSKKK